MVNANKSAVESLGIVKGHYECRFFDETVPVLSELTAIEVIDRRDDEVIMKHPNTDWLLVIHQSGARAPDKPFRNHYGVRVTDNGEVDRAYHYLMAKKDELGLKKVIMRNERSGSYSVFFVEPGGNYWEIESYQHRCESGLSQEVSYPWTAPLTEARFPGRGYIPQAFTHGTIECNDWASSVKFYTEGLGMEMITHVTTPKPHNIKHPAHPWYVVSLEVPERSRKYLGPFQRFTIGVASPAKVSEAHEALKARRDEFALTEIGEIHDSRTGRSFLLCDLNRNWWEIEWQSSQDARNDGVLENRRTG
jgi:catechol 2,3-dioxygenase-like lactoylglutathione lyase family enzyme